MTAFEATFKSGGHSLARYAPALAAMQLSLLTIGMIFWIDAMTGAEGFKVETWGRLAYMLPAEFWALINMVASAMTFIGLLDPIKRRLVMIGGALHCIQFATLGYSITMTGGEVPVGLYAGAFFLPVHMWMVWRSVTEHAP